MMPPIAHVLILLLCFLQAYFKLESLSFCEHIFATIQVYLNNVWTDIFFCIASFFKFIETGINTSRAGDAAIFELALPDLKRRSFLVDHMRFINILDENELCTIAERFTTPSNLLLLLAQ